jgi:co-chaperonin GroES (HSP10)
MILLRDRLIVRPDKPKTEDASGLTLVTEEKVKRGIVEEVGGGVKDVKKGDHIMYSPFHYDEVDEGTIIIAEEDVWAVLNR